MMYIYDVLINFNDEVLNFYEWEESDILSHVKKTLLVKVNNNVYKMLVKKCIEVDNGFLELIKNRTEIYNNKKLETLDYACVFTNGTDALMVSFNKSGQIMERSKFLVEEELEILEIANNIVEKNVKYTVIKSNYKLDLFRREEKKIVNLILKELENIKEDEAKIKYLYFEWFDKRSEETNIYRELVKSIKENFTEKHRDFLNILKLIAVEK